MSGQEQMKLHLEAMRLAQDALVAKFKGDYPEAKRLNQEAFQMEKEVAMSLVESSNEPIRSVIFRSAASIAIECGFYQEAERMVGYALTGNPNDEIRNELRELFEDIKFYQSLNEKGIALSFNSMLISFSGNEVASGLINYHELGSRFKALESLTYRTAERKHNRPFRQEKVPPKEIINNFNPYVAYHRGSFVVEVRFGNLTGQGDLFGPPQVSVLEEMVECFDLASQEKDEDLRKRIVDKDYYENFVKLTKAIAPDGDKIKRVSVTIKDRLIVNIKRSKSEFPTFKGKSDKDSGDQNLLTVVGYLKMADAEMKRIRIVDDKDSKDSKFTIAVSEGMSDLVRIFFDDRVRATVRKKSATLYELVDMDKDE